MGIKLQKGDIKKTKGNYKIKALMVIIDELGEVMNSDDYRSVSQIKSDMGSIGRLGRAAGCHMALATQRASSGVISGELMNNIQQRVILGDFDSGASSNLFEKDVSHMAKPEIKGRGFMKQASKILEFQSYYTDPDKDFVFESEHDNFYTRLEQYRQDNPIIEMKKEVKKDSSSSNTNELREMIPNRPRGGNPFANRGIAVKPGDFDGRERRSETIRKEMEIKS